jgi:hypothetical protein
MLSAKPKQVSHDTQNPGMKIERPERIIMSDESSLYNDQRYVFLMLMM